MSFLYNLLILPIESLIEFIFCFVYKKFSAFGVTGCIVAVSLAVNFLALPLYNMADALQLKERNIQLKMQKWIRHIKKTFKGDEQFMMLNTYYRQNNYHPLYALRSALSILIEIPFFIAAYHFLSHCSLLNGQSILFLKDLGSPDSLFSIGNFSINVLPIFMTLVNVVSSAIYTKGAPLREKVQVYVLALVFLVLLYDSPSGLVFYWILNNTFSLAKNVVLKMKKPGLVVYGFIAAIMVALSLFIAFFMNHTSLNKKIACWLVAALVIAVPPMVMGWKKRKSVPSACNKEGDKEASASVRMLKGGNTVLFFVSCFVLWLLTGVLLPTNVISTSPQEFAFIGTTESPFSYIGTSLFYFAGIFLFWPFMIWKMFDEKVKKIMPGLFFVLAVCALANVYIFKESYGTINIFFRLENQGTLSHSPLYVVGVTLFILVPVLIYAVCERFKKINILYLVLCAVIAGELFVSVSNLSKINRGWKELDKDAMRNQAVASEKEMEKEFHLSRDQKNVVIFFMDRGISSFFPHILDQFPELKKSYSGFTYYPNTLSFGGTTIIGSGPMMGGYDYIPENLDKKENQLLSEKQNEAVMVLPENFHNAGWDVTVADAPYANYTWFFNKDFYKDNYPYVDAKTLNRKYGTLYSLEHEGDFDNAPSDVICRTYINRFSLMQIIHPGLRFTFYQEGNYFADLSFFSDPDFVDDYAELYYLPKLTAFDAQNPTYTFIGNTTAHSFVSLLEPDFHPGKADENHHYMGLGNYDAKGAETMDYPSNAAALIQFGKWLDYLKENEVYDNTRIIIVSDHGFRHTFRAFEAFGEKIDSDTVGQFNPLLLVKDFEADGLYKVDNSFMTNADTPRLAVKNLEVSDVNPFTGNAFQSTSDYDSFEVLHIDVDRFMPEEWKNEYTFYNSGEEVYRVKTNIFEESNWERVK